MVRYVELAHDVRWPEIRRLQAQVLSFFGREEEVDRGTWNGWYGASTGF